MTAMEIACECAARYWEKKGIENLAKAFRAGTVDNAVIEVQVVLHAIAMFKEALQGFGDDYMTSETHHPVDVLIPKEQFERILEFKKGLDS